MTVAELATAATEGIDGPIPIDGAPASIQDEARRSTRTGGIGLIGAMFSGLFGFVLAIAITRSLNPTGSGDLFAVIGLVTIASGICCLGADTGLIWALPKRRKGAGGLGSLLTVALLPAITFSAAVAAIGWVTAPILARAIIDHADPHAVALVRLTIAAIPVVVLSTLLLASVRATRSIGAYVWVQFILMPVTRPILVVLAAVTGVGILFAMGGWLLPVGLAVIVCALMLIGPLRGEPARGLRPRPGDWRMFWAFAAPRAFSAAIDASSMWIGVILSASLAGSAAAGVFGAAGRYVLAGQLVMQGLRVAVAPQLSRLLGAGSDDAAAEVHRTTTTWILGLSWPFYLLLALFAPVFLHIFGSGFVSGASALTVLALAMLVNVGLGNVQTLLLMSGKSGLHLVATVAGLATQVGLGFAIIPAHGALGAAYSWAAGIVVENTIAAVAARRVLGRPIASGRLATVAGGVSVVTIASGGLAVAIAGRTIPGLALALGLLIAVCVGVLALRRVRIAVRSAINAFRQTGETGGALHGNA